MAPSDIENLRKRLGLSQQQLADALGVAGRNVISRWEIGKRTPVETVRRLILVLNELPEAKSKELIEKLGSYGKKAKRRK